MMEGLIVDDYYLCRMVALNLSYTLNHLGDLEGKKKTLLQLHPRNYDLICLASGLDIRTFGSSSDFDVQPM